MKMLQPDRWPWQIVDRSLADRSSNGSTDMLRNIVELPTFVLIQYKEISGQQGEWLASYAETSCTLKPEACLSSFPTLPSTGMNLNLKGKKITTFS